MFMVNACGLERVPDSDLDLLLIPENLHSETSFLEKTAEKANVGPARDLARQAVKFLVVELYCIRG